VTDNRCPKCDRPVRGREEIILTAPRVAAVSCRHCGASIKLVRSPITGDGHYKEVK